MVNAAIYDVPGMFVLDVQNSYLMSWQNEIALTLML